MSALGYLFADVTKGPSARPLTADNPTPKTACRPWHRIRPLAARKRAYSASRASGPVSMDASLSRRSAHSTPTARLSGAEGM